MVALVPSKRLTIAIGWPSRARGLFLSRVAILLSRYPYASLTGSISPPLFAQFFPLFCVEFGDEN